MTAITVLTVDDDFTQLELVAAVIGADETHEIELLRATSIAEATRIFDSRHIDIVIADYLLPDGTGLELLAHVKDVNPLVNVLMITGSGSVEPAVSAMKGGADDYLIKPIDGRYLMRVIQRIIESRHQSSETAHLAAPHLEGHVGDIMFRSEQMANVVNIALRGAGSMASVLIRGESGTGKELVARLIHDSSPRRAGPFVAVNAAALPESLVESELFGHRKGAFTGAAASREGRFVAAEGGTLFLDELGDIPLSVQVKLLRAIQFRQVEPLGTDRPVDIDVRIIAATNRDLEQMIAERTFREDLYYRLNVLSIEIPPLRDRKMDIPPLAEHMLARMFERGETRVRGFTAAALDKLIRYDYPGNVRELENIVERALVVASVDRIDVSDLPPEVQHSSRRSELSADAPPAAHPTERRPDGSLDRQLEELERAVILAALEQSSGNQSRAAERLGIGERRLRSRLQRLGIENRFRLG